MPKTIEETDGRYKELTDESSSLLAFGSQESSETCKGTSQLCLEAGAYP